MIASVVFAVLSAVSFALATVSQHRAARTAHPATGLGLGLLRRLARRPLWLLGLVSGAVGLVLHGLALSLGQLTVVQPVLVSGLLFALPLSLLVERTSPKWREWVWAVAVVLGLALFLLAARPSPGVPLADEGALAGLGGAVMAVAAVAVALAATTVRRHRAALLGTAAGLSFGVTAALLKQVVGELARGPLVPFTDWSMYALLLVGGTGLVLTQTAYQAGRLAASLPPMTIVDPIAAIAIGALCFDEQLTARPLAVAGQLVGFAIMTVAVIRLTALTAQDDGEPRAAPARPDEQVTSLPPAPARCTG